MSLSLGIALLVTAILSLAILLLWNRLAMQQMKDQNLQSLQVLATALTNSQVMNQTLVNLLTSKDPMTFQSLQAVSPQVHTSTSSANSAWNKDGTFDEVVTGNDEEEWERWQKSQGKSDAEIDALKTDLTESGILNFS